jgi:hypothetical protein
MANDYAMLHENCKVDSFGSPNIDETLAKRKKLPYDRHRPM